MAQTIVTTPEVQAAWLRHMWNLAVKFDDPWLAAALVENFPESVDVPSVVRLLAE